MSFFVVLYMSVLASISISIGINFTHVLDAVFVSP